jgi:ATP-binding cassette subfamily E protein 1
MIAGVETPDKGESDLKMQIAYKPQYLELPKGQTVKEYLDSKKINMDLFKSEVDRRLDVSSLFDSYIEDLSGGELQKVAVTAELCSDYDLLLMDEPTAYVDVEDRLEMAEAIKGVIDKKGKVAMIVDHDILFQDTVSDRLIVFSGIPAEKGNASKPMPMHEGMNSFLKEINVTFRRDPQTGRPRANKPNSQMEKEQIQSGEYYYTTK